MNGTGRPLLRGELDSQGAVAARDGHRLVAERARLDVHAGERGLDLRGVRERVGEGGRRVGSVVDELDGAAAVMPTWPVSSPFTTNLCGVSHNPCESNEKVYVYLLGTSFFWVPHNSAKSQFRDV